jgi:putative PIN family toxin of toxin-antitoxin system
MRAVLDANILGPGLMMGRGAPSDVVKLWRAGRFDLIVSEHLLGELTRTLMKPYWQTRFTAERIDGAIELAHTEARLADPLPVVRGVATHWQDDRVIATALAGSANYLVTGDKELLRLKSYRTVRIVAPLEFLEFLRAEDEAGTGS